MSSAPEMFAGQPFSFDLNRDMRYKTTMPGAGAQFLFLVIALPNDGGPETHEVCQTAERTQAPRVSKKNWHRESRRGANPAFERCLGESNGMESNKQNSSH